MHNIITLHSLLSSLFFRSIISGSLWITSHFELKSDWGDKSLLFLLVAVEHINCFNSDTQLYGTRIESIENVCRVV